MMRRWMPALMLCLACGATKESVAPTPEGAPATPPAAPEPAPTPEQVDETGGPPAFLHGEACGERGYVRAYQFAADGTYQGKDYVSPCPPAARCAWSGIVEHSGTWARTAQGGLGLVEGDARAGPGATTRGARLLATDAGFTDDLGCNFAEAAAWPRIQDGPALPPRP